MSIATQVMNQFSAAGGAIGGVVGKTAEKADDIAGAVAGNPISMFKLLENSPVPENNDSNKSSSLSDGVQPKLDKPDEQTLSQWNPPALLAEAHKNQEMQAKMMTQMSVEQMMQKGWDNVDG